MILADTDVLIDYLAGIQPATSQITRYAGAGRLQTTAITCFELLSGAGEGKGGDAIRQLISALDVLPLDRQAARPSRTVPARRTIDASCALRSEGSIATERQRTLMPRPYRNSNCA